METEESPYCSLQLFKRSKEGSGLFSQLTSDRTWKTVLSYTRGGIDWTLGPVDLEGLDDDDSTILSFLLTLIVFLCALVETESLKPLFIFHSVK